MSFVQGAGFAMARPSNVGAGLADETGLRNGFFLEAPTECKV
jgi:hypothetical protein